MGGNEAVEETPVHQVSPHNAYYIDKYQVTEEQYAKFLAASSHGAPSEWKVLNQPSHQKHPVVMRIGRMRTSIATGPTYYKNSPSQNPTGRHEVTSKCYGAVHGIAGYRRTTRATTMVLGARKLRNLICGSQTSVNAG
jgi:Sulfatase-modifying factor enzyme 1